MCCKQNLQLAYRLAPKSPMFAARLPKLVPRPPTCLPDRKSNAIHVASSALAMELVWVMCRLNNGRQFPVLMLFPVFMHVEELANRLQAIFLDGGWVFCGGYIRLSSMTSCLSRVGQGWSLVLWCGHLCMLSRSLNQSKACAMGVFQDCLSCLASFHMLHRMVLPPELFFTHSENRSRLMLDESKKRKTSP